MDIEAFRSYCLNKKEVEDSFPFGEKWLVFKVLNKVFAITDLDESDLSVNLKCDPDRAIQLREEYREIQPGYHMNKKHWNTVSFIGSLSDEFLCELIDHSYERVVKGMPKKEQEYLKNISS